jgi:hypothetical protein
MREYEGHEKLLVDIEKRHIPARQDSSYVYSDLREQLTALRPSWIL